MLAVGDTTFFDYKNIKAKGDGYGPIGNGGNGLILHTTLAVKPEQGQSEAIIVAETLASGTKNQTACQ